MLAVVPNGLRVSKHLSRLRRVSTYTTMLFMYNHFSFHISSDYLESNVKGVKKERVEPASPTDNKKSAAGRNNVKVKREGANISNIETTVAKNFSGCFLYICGSSEMDQIPLTSRDEVAVRTSGGVTNYTDTYEAKLPNPIVYFRKKPIKKVACGALHTAVLLEDGTVYTFGCNDLGALGRNVSVIDKAGMSDETEAMPIKMNDKIIDITCGDNHTCLLTASGDVYLTGSFKDTSGPIGFPDFTSEDTKILDKVTLPMKVVFDKNKKVTITNISSGENHVVCLNSNTGELYVFGSNEYGQLLQPITDETSNLSSEKLHEIKGKKLYPKLIDLKILGLRGSTRSQEAEKIAKVFTGYATTFFVTNKQRIFGCGRNAQGEVGVGNPMTFIDKPKELTSFNGKSILDIKGGQFFSMALEKGGAVYTWGKTCFSGHSIKAKKIMTPKRLNICGKLGAVCIFVGSDYSFAKMSNNNVYAWGSGQNYVLGNGQDIEFQQKPVLVDLGKLGTVTSISGGAQHTVFHVIPEAQEHGTSGSKKRKTS